MNKKKIIFGLLTTTCVIIVTLTRYNIGFLQSSVLDTNVCNNEILAEKKLTYQHTLHKVQTIDTFLAQNNCTDNQNQKNLCDTFSKEKKDLESALKEYDDCRTQLHKAGTLVENVSSFVPPATDLKKGEYSFGNPGFTAHGADEYSLSRGGDSPVGDSYIVGTSFQGGIYRHISRSNIILRTYFYNNKEIIDSTFIGRLPEKTTAVNRVQEYADGSIYVFYNLDLKRQKLIKLQKDGSIDASFPVINNISRSGEETWKFGNNKKFFGLFEYKNFGFVDLDSGHITTSKTITMGTGMSIYFKEKLIQRMKVLGTQGNGTWLIQSEHGLSRLDENAELDIDFVPTINMTSEGSRKCGLLNSLTQYVLLPDDSLVVTGNFTHINGIPRNCIARLTPDGELDKKFDPGSGFDFGNNVGNGYLIVIPDSQKKLIIQGNFSTYQGKNISSQDGIATYMKKIRLNLDGSLDTTFIIHGDVLNHSVERGYTSIFPLRDGKILNYNSNDLDILIPKNIYQATESKKLDTENYTENELSADVSHKDDFSRGMYRVGKKIYIPFYDIQVGENTINVYNLGDMSLRKKIKRDDEYIPPGGLGYDLVENRGVVDGNYLYIGSKSGIDIIDTQKDEIIKTILKVGPDELPSTNVSKPTLPPDAISTFEYNGDTYVIRSDRVIYKLEQVNTPVKKEKYITLYPGVHTSVTHDGGLMLYINVMQKIKNDIYVLARDRMLIIDTKTKEITQEITYSETPETSLPSMYRRQSFYKGPLISANNKIYLFSSSGQMDYALRNLHVQVFGINTRNVIKTLENTKDVSVDKAQNGSLCPIPSYIRSIYIDKNTIYIYTPWDGKLGDSTLFTNPGKCEIMKLDTQNDTFTPVANPSKEIIYNLSLAQNAAANGKVSFKYNDTYIVPSIFDSSNNSLDSTYDIAEGASYTKKGNTNTRPIYNIVPMMQDGETLYYTTPGFVINMYKMDLSVGKAGSVSYNHSITYSSDEQLGRSLVIKDATYSEGFFAFDYNKNSFLKVKINDKGTVEIDKNYPEIDVTKITSGTPYFDKPSIHEYSDKSKYVYSVSSNDSYITRIKTDGTIDDSFGTQTLDVFGLGELNVHFLRDKKIFVNGNRGASSSRPIRYIFDLEKKTKTYLDVEKSPFNIPLIFVGQQPDGKIIVKDGTSLYYRINMDGSLDSSYHQIRIEPGKNCPKDGPSYGSYASQDFTMLPDGSVVFMGDFSSIDGTARKCFAKILPNGEIDKNFDPKNAFHMVTDTCVKGRACYDQIYKILHDGLGHVIVIGGFDSYQDTPQSLITIINNDGNINKDIKTPDISLGFGQNFTKSFIDKEDNIIIDNFNSLIALARRKYN